jgi:hypothetical protein
MKTNLQFFLNSYNDLCPTSAPSQNNFRWLREINGIPYSLENSQQIQVSSSATTPNLIPYPFSTAVLNTTATTNSTTTLTITGSTTGIAAGQLIVGGSIPVGTIVDSITGSTVTMSQAATGTGSPAVSFYNPASFVYMESDQQISMIYNNGSPVVLNPFEINGMTMPGVFFLNGPVYSLTVTNVTSTTANVFFALMG